jgi:hypothetical protein
MDLVIMHQADAAPTTGQGVLKRETPRESHTLLLIMCFFATPKLFKHTELNTRQSKVG